MPPGPIQLNKLDAFVAQANALGMHAHAERNAFRASRSLAARDIQRSSFVPRQQGINSDSRRLGIAVGAIVL